MFKFRMILLYILLAFGLLLTACSGIAVAVFGPQVADDQPATAVIEPNAANDASDVLIAALKSTGATVEQVGDVAQPFFSVPGQVVSLNGHDVQLFVYADAVSAQKEAAQVSPEGTAVGGSSMMWLATPHFYSDGRAIALYIGDDAATLALLETVFGPQFAGGQPAVSSDDIGAAALAGLEAIGWDVVGGGFTAEVEAVDGDYARVTVHSTNPPGGFTVFMTRQDGAWTVAAHGSAYNPEHIKEMGFPDSVMP